MTAAQDALLKAAKAVLADVYKAGLPTLPPSIKALAAAVRECEAEKKKEEL